jgi:hypothetical protein
VAAAQTDRSSTRPRGGTRKRQDGRWPASAMPEPTTCCGRPSTVVAHRPGGLRKGDFVISHLNTPARDAGLRAATDGVHDRHESDSAEADRRYTELLQELRVAQTGVQFLFAFLLTPAFTQRSRRSPTSSCGSTSARSSLRRSRPRCSSARCRATASSTAAVSSRGWWRRLTGWCAPAAAALVIAINSAILLVLDAVLGGWLPFLLTGLTTLWFVFVGYVVPRTARERPQ